MDALVGHTGFVGGNLLRQHQFDGRFNTGNIADIRCQQFDTLVCSAVPATMWMANNAPNTDRANILELFENLRSVQVNRLVLVSTIAVYRDASLPVDETSTNYQSDLAYGKHRRELEELVVDHFPKVLVLRLPALFGDNLKKNFLFDMLNPIPSFLKTEVFQTVLGGLPVGQKEILRESFSEDTATGMFRFNRDQFGHGAISYEIRDIVQEANASAVQFTHQDSLFQFYDLQRLWQDIGTAFNSGINVLNLATEPILAGDIFRKITGREMQATNAAKVMQDMRSCHSDHWSRKDGYLYGRNDTLTALRDFFASKANAIE